MAERSRPGEASARREGVQVSGDVAGLLAGDADLGHGGGAVDGLRILDPEDPVRFDFALCHFGMSGACPLRPGQATCSVCPLIAACKTGPRILRRARES